MSWSTGREALAVVGRPDNLKRTATIACVVGTVFFATNQLGPILGGHADAITWAKSALTYLTPFCVSNYSLLVASRAHQT
jgi:hypothetical protein